MASAIVETLLIPLVDSNKEEIIFSVVLVFSVKTARI